MFFAVRYLIRRFCHNFPTFLPRFILKHLPHHILKFAACVLEVVAASHLDVCRVLSVSISSDTNETSFILLPNLQFFTVFAKKSDSRNKIRR